MYLDDVRKCVTRLLEAVKGVLFPLKYFAVCSMHVREL